MEEFDRSTQYSDLKGAVDKAKKNSTVKMSGGAKAMLAGLGIMAATGIAGGAYSLLQKDAGLEPDDYVAGQFLVKFDYPIDVMALGPDENVITGLPEVDGINQRLEGEVYEQLVADSPEHELDNWYVVDIDDSLDLESWMKEFEDAEGVEMVGYDLILTIPELQDSAPEGYSEAPVSEGTIPNDRYFSTEDTFKEGVKDMWALWGSGAIEAWETEKGSDELIFAVLDTGIADDHPDITNRMWRNEAELNGIPGVDDDHNGYIDDIFGINTVDPNGTTYDGHGHGTHVSGTIAADTNNEIGIAGINWYGKLMAVKVLSDGGSGSLSGIAEGIVYATDNGAILINMSLGGPSSGRRTILDEAIDYADSKGVSVIVAAGNSNQDAKNFTPANHPLVITVAAIGPDFARTAFTNWGETVDVAAPGQYIVSTVPAKHHIPTSRYKCITAEDGKNNYCELAGTSMASPNTAGLVGLIYAANPNLIGNTEKVREIVRAAVRPYESDKYIGTGRIDYALAVEKALEE